MSRHIVIAVAPNGARRTQIDHPALPLSPEETAATVLEAAVAGASMAHVHVRDGSGEHSLNADAYLRILELVKTSSEFPPLLQFTTEAAGLFDVAAQLTCMNRVAPNFVSIAVREVFPADIGDRAVTKRASSIRSSGCPYQLILYNEWDVLRRNQLIEQGHIRSGAPVLIVLGRDDSMDGVRALESRVALLSEGTSWMACAFGNAEQDLLLEAAKMGGDVRIGFENNLYAPSGRRWRDNSEAIEAFVERLQSNGFSIATTDCAYDRLVSSQHD